VLNDGRCVHAFTLPDDGNKILDMFNLLHKEMK
jgi:hypothetical protein